MYFFDHDPPHFHVIAGGKECQMQVSDQSVMAGKVSRKAMNAARSWAAKNSALLMSKWSELHAE